MADLSLLTLVSGRQDRLEERIGDVEDGVEEIPVLRKEVEMLMKAVDRNTTALYTVVGSVVATGIVAILFEKGLVG